MSILDARWFLMPLEASPLLPGPDSILEPLFANIRTQNVRRLQACQDMWRIYGIDTEPFGGPAHVYSNLRSPDEGGVPNSNELANTIESMYTEIYRHRILPTYVTSDADYDEFERARGTTWFVEGVLDDAAFSYCAEPQAGLESLVCGTGIFEVSSVIEGDSARITVEAPTVQDIFVDPIEARSGRPRTYFRRKLVDRFKAIQDLGTGEGGGLYGDPEQRKAALESLVLTADDCTTYRSQLETCDMVWVFEVFYEPSHRGGDDGRHCIWIPGQTLLFEKWKRKAPFAAVRWQLQPGNFWGQSPLERLAPQQYYYDKLIGRIDHCHDILGVPKLLIPDGTGIKPQHIDDVPGSFLKYSGQKPEEWNPVPITPDAYRERDSTPNRMRQSVGVSNLSAYDQLPPQMREASGKALESMTEHAGDARAMEHRFREYAIKELGDLILDEAEYLQELGYDVVATPTINGDTKEVKFSDVKMDRSKLRCRIFPVSNLSRSYSARMAELDRLRQQNAITLSTYRRLTDNPDVQMENELDTSDEEIIDQNLNWMLKTGNSLDPLPYDNLEVLVLRTTKFINKCRVRGKTQLELAGLFYYLAEGTRMLNEKQAKAAPPPPPAGPGAPPGPPGPGPSDVPMPGPSGSPPV